MGKEIERKFLAVGEGWRSGPGVLYRQGYLNTDRARTVRVRLEGERAVLTVKGPAEGITRCEFEYEVPREEAEQMLESLSDGALIEKRRYSVECGDFTWEVDEFLGDNAGLVVAEIELDTEEQEFDRPQWLGEEVSHDPRYYNANLVKHPYSRWREQDRTSRKYRFTVEDSVAQNVRDIAARQLDKALRELTDNSLDRHDVVHQFRKRCKKLRGLIRLVRPAFGEYGHENACFRDAARSLSYLRDAQSVIECYDDLVGRFEEQLDPGALEPIRRALETRRDEIVADQAAPDEGVETVLQQMQAARGRVDSWRLDADGFAAVAGGLEKTYRRAREGLRRCYDDGDAGQFHEWRKRVKYHWYHCRLLRPVWPAMMRRRARECSALADILGDEHNLTVLRQTLLAETDRFGSGVDVQAVIALVDRYRLELQAKARPLGERLFAEKPKHFVRRIGRYWHTGFAGYDTGT